MMDNPSDALAVRFERLNVLSSTIEDMADNLRQLPSDKVGTDDMARRIQSASAFLTRELWDAEEEYSRLTAASS